MGDLEMSPVNTDDQNEKKLTLTASGKILEDPFGDSTFQFLYSDVATTKQRIFAVIISGIHIASFIFILQYIVSTSSTCNVKAVTPKADKFQEILEALAKTPEFSNLPGAADLINGGASFGNFFPDDYAGFGAGGGYDDYHAMMMDPMMGGGYPGPTGSHDSYGGKPPPDMGAPPPGMYPEGMDDPCAGIEDPTEKSHCNAAMKSFGTIPTGFAPSPDGLSSGNPSCDDCVAGMRSNGFCTAAPNQLQPVLSLAPPQACGPFLLELSAPDAQSAEQIQVCYKVYKKVCGDEQDKEKKAAAANGLMSTLLGAALLMIFLLPEMSKGITLFRLNPSTLGMKIAGAVQVLTGIIAMMVASILITNEFGKCEPDGLVSAAAPVAVSFLNEVPQKAYQFYEETGAPMFYCVMMGLGFPIALMFTAMANPSILSYIMEKLAGEETFGAVAKKNSTNSSTTTTTTTASAQTTGGDTTTGTAGGDTTGTAGGDTTGTAGADTTGTADPGMGR
jgi:hypothetical protein